MDITWWMVTATYLLLVGVTLLFFGVLNLFWGEYVVFPFDKLWSTDKTVGAGLAKVWFIFAWAAGATLLIGLITRNMPRSHSSGRIFGAGMWISLHAGIFEELTYRWLRFSIAMITFPFVNWLLLGFIPGFPGLLRWAYESFLIPIANFVTFGALDDYLFYPTTWVVGAAIISANGKFLEAHEQNGWLNQINAWFIGMVMFYLMFSYGLFTAIIAHVLYDVVVFATAAMTNSWRPGMARAVPSSVRLPNILWE